MSNSNKYQPLAPSLTEKYKELSDLDKQELAAAFFERFKLKDRTLRYICLGEKAPSLEQREFLTDQITARWTAAFVPADEESQLQSA